MIPRLELQQIVKRYDGVEAVSGVDMSLAPGAWRIPLVAWAVGLWQIDDAGDDRRFRDAEPGNHPGRW